MTCIIKVWGRSVDVEAVYRERGFEVLPPTLTMTREDLIHYGEVPYDRTILKNNSDTPIGANEAVPVSNGDEFYAVPQAHY